MKYVTNEMIKEGGFEGKRVLNDIFRRPEKAA